MCEIKSRARSFLNMKTYIIIIFGLCIAFSCNGKKSDQSLNGDDQENPTMFKKSTAKVDEMHTGNLLFFHHMGSRSHLHFIRPLAERLAEVGHNVTLVQYEPSKFHNDKFTEILIKNK